MLAQAELVAGLGARRDLDLRLGAVDRRHLDVAAQRGLRHAQRHAHEDIGAVALEDRMRLDRDVHVEIARRRALAAGLAFAGSRMRVPSSTPAGIVTCSERSRCTVPAPWQMRHGLRITRPCAAAGRAGALDQEEALLRAHLAGALAGRAGVAPRARLVFRPGARCTPRRPTRVGTRSVDLGAGERLGQLDLDRLAQMSSPARVRPRAAAAAAHEVAEHLVEDVAERRRRAEKSKPAGEPPAPPCSNAAWP